MPPVATKRSGVLSSTESKERLSTTKKRKKLDQNEKTDAENKSPPKGRKTKAVKSTTERKSKLEEEKMELQSIHAGDIHAKTEAIKKLPAKGRKVKPVKSNPEKKPNCEEENMKLQSLPTGVIKEKTEAKNKSPAKSRKAKPMKSSPEKKPKYEEKKMDLQSVSTADINSMNIEQLLALGESSQIVNITHNNNNISSHSEDSSDMSDFEEVKNAEISEPIIPKDGVNITLEVPSLHRKHKQRGLDMEGHLRRQLNRVKKDMQLLMHKVHLLCWIAHLRFVNNTLNTPSLMTVCMKLVKSKNLYPKKYSDLDYLEGILKWFHKNIELKRDLDDSPCTGGLLKELSYQFEHKQAFSCRAFTFMFIILLRVLGLKARIVMSFQVLPVKPALWELYDRFQPKKKSEEEASTSKNDKHAEMKKSNKEGEKTIEVQDNTKQKRKSTSQGGKKSSKKESETPTKKAKAENSDDEFESRHFRPSLKSARSKNKSETNKDANGKSKKSLKKESSPVELNTEEKEDDDFTPVSLNKRRSKEKSERRSGGEEIQECKKKEPLDVWTEVYLEAEEKWISVDVPRQKIHCVGELYSRATHPVVYVIACNNDLTLKDVTKRYVPNWHSDTRKKRVEEDWWNETMKPYLPPKTAQDKEEDEDINRQLSDKPLPSSISEYKDHPLYVLKRHLLKFEAIYPADAPTLGFVRGEPVYARECVHLLHSREMWYKQARVVRLKEEPYKIVKARPKYDKMTGEIKKDLPLELFGVWQTEEYIPPIATDGKVPRNEYGNVDLFKPCMLPIGTVHLQIPALNRIAKKLNIDCAPATVGFEFHSGWSHPVFDGFVVCQEFKEILLDTWNKEIDESAKKEEEKREKRVYGNWRRLIRGLLIREKLKIKYAFGEHSDDEGGSKPSTANASK